MITDTPPCNSVDSLNAFFALQVQTHLVFKSHEKSGCAAMENRTKMSTVEPYDQA